MVDFDQTPRHIGELTGGLLKMLLRQAVDAQRAGAGATDADDPAPSTPS